MSRVKELQAMLNEEVTQVILDKIESMLDKLFSKLNIDIEFTRHFLDRVNDMRNNSPIKPEELLKIFSDTYKKHGPDLKNMGDNVEAVLKDLQTDINIPFVLNYDFHNGKIELVSKTVMRKKNFMTSNPVLKV